MSGLYQRALEIYRQTVGLHLVPTAEAPSPVPPSAGPSIEELSPSERERILHQMDQEVSHIRTALEPEELRLAPRHSGRGLPLLINGGAVLVLAAAIAVSSLLLNRQEQVLAAESGSVLSAESKLIETLREQSQRELAAKDRSIREAQQRLAEASAERERLRDETAAEIRRREGELAAELERALEAERARLQAQGLSAASVDQRLESFEAERRAELERQAEAFRRNIQEEAARRERQIAELSGQYEQTLRQAQEERARLEGDLQARQAELQEQLRAQGEQTRSLERERAAAAAELARLQEAGARESLVLDQLLTMYDAVNRQLSAGQDARALQSLQAMRAYFDQEPARSLPGIQRRRPVETFLIDSLEQLLQARQARLEQQNTAGVLDAATRLEALRQGVARADERFQAQDYPTARTLYLEALAEVPEAARGRERLALVADTERERVRRGGLELAAAGAQAYGAGEWQGTLDRYRQALGVLLGDEVVADRLVQQVGRAARELAQEAEAQAAPAAGPAAAADAEARARAEAEAARLDALVAEQAATLKQYAEQLGRLQQDNARLTAALGDAEAGASLARQEQLAAQRIVEAYQSVNRSLQRGRYADAGRELSALRSDLDQEPARSLPGMQVRRPVELFLISSLEELIAARTRQEEAGDSGAAAAAATAAADAAARRAGQASAALQAAGASYAEGQYDGALEQYRQALALLLEDGTAAGRVVDQVAEAGYQLKAAPLQAEAAGLRAEVQRAQATGERLQAEAARREAEREALRSRLGALQERYAQERRLAGRSGQTSPEQLATLLQAKLLTLQILASAPVAASHPQLYDQLQEYLDVFADQQLLAGRYTGLQDALSVLDEALGTRKSAAERLGELWRRYVYTDRDDVLEDLFGRLQTLLE